MLGHTAAHLGRVADDFAAQHVHRSAALIDAAAADRVVFGDDGAVPEGGGSAPLVDAAAGSSVDVDRAAVGGLVAADLNIAERHLSAGVDAAALIAGRVVPDQDRRSLRTGHAEFAAGGIHAAAVGRYVILYRSCRDLDGAAVVVESAADTPGEISGILRRVVTDFSARHHEAGRGVSKQDTAAIAGAVVVDAAGPGQGEHTGIHTDAASAECSPGIAVDGGAVGDLAAPEGHIAAAQYMDAAAGFRGLAGDCPGLVSGRIGLGECRAVGRLCHGDFLMIILDGQGAVGRDGRRKPREGKAVQVHTGGNRDILVGVVHHVDNFPRKRCPVVVDVVHRVLHRAEEDSVHHGHGFDLGIAQRQRMHTPKRDRVDVGHDGDVAHFVQPADAFPRRIPGEHILRRNQLEVVLGANPVIIVAIDILAQTRRVVIDLALLQGKGCLVGVSVDTAAVLHRLVVLDEDLSVDGQGDGIFRFDIAGLNIDAAAVVSCFVANDLSSGDAVLHQILIIVANQHATTAGPSRVAADFAAGHVQGCTVLDKDTSGMGSRHIAGNDCSRHDVQFINSGYIDTASVRFCRVATDLHVISDVQNATFRDRKCQSSDFACTRRVVDDLCPGKQVQSFVFVAAKTYST